MLQFSYILQCPGKELLDNLFIQLALLWIRWEQICKTWSWPPGPCKERFKAMLQGQGHLDARVETQLATLTLSAMIGGGRLLRTTQL